jgi:hypothetical protein
VVQNWLVAPKFPYAPMIVMFAIARQYHIDKQENSMQPVTTNGAMKNSTKRSSFLVFPLCDSSVKSSQEPTRACKKKDCCNSNIYFLFGDNSLMNFELRSDVDSDD